MTAHTVLETARLTLRRIANDDAPFIVTLLNDPDFLRYIGDRNVRTIEDAHRYLATGPGAMYERFGHGLWLVTLTSTNEPLGICGLLKRDTLEDVDLGYAFLPQFRSQGYAEEAARGCMAYAGGVLGLRRVVAIVQPDNARSIRLLEKLGFAREKLMRLTEDGHEVALMGAAITSDGSP